MKRGNRVVGKSPFGLGHEQKRVMRLLGRGGSAGFGKLLKLRFPNSEYPESYLYPFIKALERRKLVVKRVGEWLVNPELTDKFWSTVGEQKETV
jgi:hypothetical protein